MTNNLRSDDIDRLRILLGAAIIFAAFVLVGLTFYAVMQKWENSNDVTAVMGAVTSIVGTLAGMIFGVQAGGQGRERDRKNLEDSHKLSIRLAAMLDHKDPQVQAVLQELAK